MSRHGLQKKCPGSGYSDPQAEFPRNTIGFLADIAGLPYPGTITRFIAAAATSQTRNAPAKLWIRG
jgi:hypothetical protein